jgi:hypothetical protein
MAITIEVIDIDHLRSVIRFTTYNVQGISPYNCTMRRRTLWHKVF